ncbi:MAG: acylphosphatase [Oscillospiraceae bacterium]|nr:acylphosphatase [Oscillospiraceae bacterium]
MGLIRKFKVNYVINQVKRAKLPAFSEGEIKRWHVVFSGKVQNVGFRLETEHLAKRLGLTGKVKNLPDGSVDLEAQGTREKVDFLVNFMKKLKRMRIDSAEITEIPLVENENDFKTV